VAGHGGQFTPGGYLSTVKHNALAGIEPTTFRLLVRRAISSSTETTNVKPTWKTVVGISKSRKSRLYV